MFSRSAKATDRRVLLLRAGRSRFTLQTLPESDFPDAAAK
jgi:DNA polymerase-3 subunit beta